MEHRPYPKIPAPGVVGARPLPAGPWIATEKIHGAHLHLASDGERVWVGKRKAWLQPDEPFFGVQLVRPALEHAALAAAAHLGQPVRLYGELFGGAYPHPDVPAVPGLSAVQTGVWYCPGLSYVLFDALIQVDDEETFLGWSALEALAEASGLRLPPILERGPRQELETLPTRFASRVPAMFNLPILPDNVAEGMVLRPALGAPPRDRPSIKRKMDQFTEAIFDEATAFDPDRRLSLDAVRELATWMVNAARIASARSKVGTARDLIADEVVLDVLVDLEVALPGALANLEPTEVNALEDHIRRWVLANPTNP